MSKKYDWNKAKEIIEANKENLAKASMGMAEDWFWTAENVWESGEYKIDLLEGLEFGGIMSSTWATPSLLLEFQDGEEVMYDCYSGESSGASRTMELGCMSGPAQYKIDSIRRG